MGTNFIRTNLNVGAVSTTRTITITTAAAQQILLLTSAPILINLQNNGPSSITLGDSAIVASSGDVVFPYASREWYPVTSAFAPYARATSVATVIAVTEYAPG